MAQPKAVENQHLNAGMHRRSSLKQQLWNYAVAIALVLMALLLMLVLDPYIQVKNTTFLIFHTALVLAAWYGGRNTGILATVLSAFLATYFFGDPIFSLNVTFASGARILIFVLQGILISVLVGALRTAQQQSKQSLKLQEAVFCEQQAVLRELQQTEVALRDSEARFQGLVSNLPGMVYRYAPCADGTEVFTYVSSGSHELTELSPETILQDAGAFLALIHPDDLPSFRESVAIAVENAIWQWEGRIITRSGQLKWIQGRSRPQQTEDGEVWDGLLVDITDRKQAEEALRRSEERQAFLLKLNDTLRPLMDVEEIQYQAACVLGEYLGASRVGYAEDQADGDTIVVTQNYTNGVPGIEGRYRYDDYGAELLREFQAGRTVVRSNIANDPMLTDAEKAAHAVLQLGATVNVPLLKAGRLVAVLFAHYPVAHSWTEAEVSLIQEVVDRIWAAVERARAEAALRQSEERYRTLFESMDEGFCTIEMIFDADDRPIDYRFLITNPAFDRQTGTENAQGRTVREIAPNHEAYWFEIYGNIALTGEARRFENRAEEFHRWYDVHAFRVGEPDLRRVGILFNDITERKQSEAILQESETRFRTLADNMAQFAWMADETGWIFWYNQRWFDYTGTTLEEMQGWGWQQVHHPEHVDRVVERIRHCFETGEVWEDTFPLRGHDGQFRWFLSRAMPIHNDRGEVVRWFGTNTDITDRLEIEAALRDRENMLGGIVGSITDALMMFDNDWRYTFVNEEFLHRIGMSLTDVLGQNVWELFPDAVGNTAYTQLHRAMAERIPVEYEVFYEPYHRWYSDKAYPTPDGGLTVYSQDITDRKQAEIELQISQERLQLALSSAKLGMWFWDIEPDTLIWTERCKALFGLPLDDSAIAYADFMAVLHPDDRERTHEAVVRAIEERADYDIEYRAVWQDGSVHWIASKGSCVFDAAGKAVRMNGVVIDIDDRKQAEENLRDREAQLASEASALVRLNEASSRLWRKLSLSEGLQEMLVATIELLGADMGNIQLLDADQGILRIAVQQGFKQDFLDFFREVSAEDDSACGRTLRSGERTIIEDVETDAPFAPFRPVARAAGYRAVQSTPLMGRDGILLGMLSTHWRSPHRPSEQDLRRLDLYVRQAADFIESIRAETALRESEELLSSTFSGVEGAITVSEVLADDEFRFLSANRVCVEWSGVPLEKWIGSRSQDILSPQEAEAVCERYRSAVRTGQVVKYEERLTLPAGEIWTYTAVTPLRDPDGRITRVVATSIDITERKQAEAALRESEENLQAALEGGQMGAWAWNPMTNTTTRDRRVLELFGLDSEATMGDTTPIFDRIHPDDRSSVIAALEAAQQPGGEYRAEFRVLLPDGKTRWLAGAGRARFNAQGRATRVYGVNFDITERQQAAQEREQLLEREQTAREQAEAANRIKDEFLAVLSHELRSPLNPILGWSKLLQKGNLNPAKTKTALATIERNAQLQAQLIDDLLDIARILRGKLSLNEAAVDLGVVISSALETVRLAAEAKALHVKVNLPTQVRTAMGDAGRLQQVVWNLLSNAVKFTPQGGQITVALTQSESYAQIQVTDTGKGIHPDFLPYVFEHFRQEDGATTRKFGGLGLGLAIARQIVELHGGTIAVESAGEGQGATFTVQLPLAPLTDQQPPSESASIEIEDLSGIRIWVVDDEIDSREFVAFVLEQAGANVASFSSGIEVLQAIEQTIPDLIVSDIGMPEMDGYMLLQQIRSSDQGRHIPAIALTAYAGEFDRQQALQAGFQQHIAKPVEPAQIVTSVARLCDQKGGTAA
ncbi:multi-sensor hybrid histidine kinase [Gloeocapsa sp. PCC 7428]|uniref:PAS domain S-box protein n=1 Tax=Gloeocapsa sp. PCC 7428 TaxID=1173026 RepID=UPI0002A5CB23|nr:PAS domain S-box protein [Gloeocapsa sp. PCC 7428]AFZ30628.1 multi-sensor hybrid histidine kinase [Gloeocapsa sp. PCC 7428]